MDKDFLYDYEQKENRFYSRFVETVLDWRFVIGKDQSPYFKRYQKLQRPITELNMTSECSFSENVWAQVPFSGSSIIAIPAFTKEDFEEQYFSVSELPNIIDFIKETGRLQFVLCDEPTKYVGLDYLDEVFTELNPPAYHMTPMGAIANETEIRDAMLTFTTLAEIRLNRVLDICRNNGAPEQAIDAVLEGAKATYVTMKLFKNPLAEQAENLLVDNPEKAIQLLRIASIFVQIPALNQLIDSSNYPLDRIKEAQTLGVKTVDLTFSNEIGKFLLSKLTYAPNSLDACKELMYHYDKYDLRKIEMDLNDAINKSDGDKLSTNSKEISAILENAWTDKTIARRINGLKYGIPLSMAAIGSVAAGPIGTAGGFLAGLGFDVINETINIGTDGLSEKLAKIRSKNYQANIFDFKKKYKIGS